ncbi:efflux RND transporter periplasmic adaptor subunit [Blastochloris sulfoviridis]|uniref:Efflux RND transporter periplasmic adaptor subunit n=1 Tax=Blastochloris sulfoviridis TaxID=50712 RepID=A0A5M6HQM0_9HYPH|nr:efflux RND transporter periplasmic adaptor subunit [Blastochloris sulfoviridis]KAA5598156.1 efflux RND transporter periplasmic adaptor subunit [Blastochloris sulfoviridis]
MKRRIVVFLVAFLAVGLCAGLVWFNFFRDKLIADIFANMPRPAQTVSATEVKATTWKPGIAAIGTARAENGVELAVQIGGLVKDILFQPNQHIEKGSIVVQIDDAVERADLIDAEAAVKLGESNLKRTETLRTRGFDTEAQFDQMVAQLAAARSKLERYRAIIDQKALKAPFSGTIGIARINPGQYVQPGTVVATLQHLDQMKVDFTVPEQVVGKVRIGQPVRFGASDDRLDRTGRIIGIDPRIDPQTRLVSVQGLLDDNRDRAVVPGQFLRVRIDLPDEPNVVVVPQTAVVTSLYGDYVYVVEETAKDGQPALTVKQVFVKVGRRDGGRSEVLSGLMPGERIVVSGQNKLQAGAPVKIDNTIDVTGIPVRDPARP